MYASDNMNGKSDRFHVLIVDDLPENIHVLAQILGSEYDISFATNGLSALKMVQTRPPSLMLLDVMMPEMDGFAVMARLQADPATRDIPVIFVTAQQGYEAETAALEAGAVDFIPRPINPSVVRARVRVQAKLLRKTRELLDLSVRYKKMADDFRELSIHDPLTGLYNRNHLLPLMAAEIAHADRDNTPLSVAMLDIDHFKQINDVHGHAQGDTVLAEMGRLIQRRLRKSDTAFRYGGEEFLLVLPQTELADAYGVCNEIRQRIATQSVGGMACGAVQLSIGIAQFLAPDCCAEQTIQRADQALYLAKNNGRNRVEVA